MALFVKDTSTVLEGLVAKRAALTQQIKDVGLKAIEENLNTIAGLKDDIANLVKENQEINDVLITIGE